MFPLSMAYRPQIFPFPAWFADNIAFLFVSGISAFLLAYLFTFGVIAICRKMGWLDRPAERRVHLQPVPRLGGVAMFLAFVIISLLFYSPDPELQAKESSMYWLFLLGAALIVAVHAYDDIKGLKPLTKLLAQTATVLIVMGPFLGWFHGVLLFGFSNPFGMAQANPALPWYLQPEISLFIHPDAVTYMPALTWLAIPATIVTWVWMVGMMNTVNLIDGLDGLATGVVVLTGLFITIISWTLKQHTIATLAAIFTGSVLGFLPHNWNPAKIFMGDSGSQFLGLALAVLSIMGGAKVALALMVLGIPILDVAIVVINRIRRGQSPVHYDKTHLHYRLLATGLSVRQICYVLYGLTATFGILALSMQRIYKLVGLGLVGIAMIALIIWMDHRRRQRSVPLDPNEPAGRNRESAPLLSPEPGDNRGGSVILPSPDSIPTHSQQAHSSL